MRTLNRVSRVAVSFGLLLLCLCSTVPFVQAQGVVSESVPEHRPPSESGAINFYLGGGGVSFGLPANRAIALTSISSTVKGKTTTTTLSAVSPEKSVLYAPSIGASVRAWKFIVPFVDMTVFSRGTATATAGPQTVVLEDTGNTFSVTGGLRLVAGKSRTRGFVEFGRGQLHISQKSTVTGNPSVSSTPFMEAENVGSFMYGAGIQVFTGRRTGFEMAFDGFHLSNTVGFSGTSLETLQPSGENFGRFRIGFFFQTKSSIQ
jgi:hypothetical protein